MAIVSLVFTESVPNAGVQGTLVLLHGLGADEYDLMGLVPYLPAGLRIVCPRAPRTCEWGGYAWFDTRFLETGITVDGAQARESLAGLVEFLEKVEGPIWLGGFSQGAMMTLGVALEHATLIQGAMVLSGGWLPCFEAQGPVGIPIFGAHGRLDPVVPFEFGEESASRLREAGIEVEFHAYPMAHEISLDVLSDGSNWLDRQVRNHPNRA